MKSTQDDIFSLIEISGAFLSPVAIKEAFPQGIPRVESAAAGKLRIAHETFVDNSGDSAAQKTWIEEVLKNFLALDQAITEGQSLPPGLEAQFPEHGEVLRPDYAVVNPAGTTDAGKIRLLIAKYPASQKLKSPVAGKRWKTSPDSRMMELLHKCGIKLGLVTNGLEWMLVYAPVDEVSGYATWDSSIFFEEPITLNAFHALLQAQQFFSVSPENTLEALYERSAQYQQDVTDQLGRQVLRAVEVLIRSFDRIDANSGRKMLAGVSEKEMYDSALVVMMRLVFLLAAEERGLLRLGEETYDDNYAVSTLRDQLRETADQFGEEVLERNTDGWARLLAVFRAIYAGINHESLRLPAYGGSLFNPDKYPFLEGRAAGTSWKTHNPNPLPVDNRVVLHLLEALQFVRTNSGRGPKESRRLSFRGLDVEQIGHIYEGLLDHTAARADSPIIGLKPAKDRVGLVRLLELEEFARDNDLTVKFIKEATGKSESAIENALKPDGQYPHLDKLRAACGNTEELYKRVLPYSGLLDEDSFGYPVVMSKSAIYVTSGSDRRSSGTHYTPRALTEPVVQYALEPLVYKGPAEGLPKDKWELKSPAELLSLKICDPAMGSGAFLVQACRYMADRLVEAWDKLEKEAGGIRITPEGARSSGNPSERLIPIDLDERIIDARRIVADRCLYGVDINPLAVEMAKLSLWLITIQRDRPFSFVDHALKCGDTLLGISNLKQLMDFRLADGQPQPTIATKDLEAHIKELSDKRKELESISSDAYESIDAKKRIFAYVEEKTEKLRLAANALIAIELKGGDDTLRDNTAHELQEYWTTKTLDEFRQWVGEKLDDHRPLNWPLEFPEIFSNNGFDALIGNPPFVGGRRIRRTLGDEYIFWLTHCLIPKSSANADLCSFFFRRGFDLLNEKGVAGLIATNTIAEGDTRDVGLAGLLSSGASIIRAVKNRKWPGAASLSISQIWYTKTKWAGTFNLDASEVNSITDSLCESGRVTGQPQILGRNLGKSFQGSIVLGSGFTLSKEIAESIIKKDPNYAQVLSPYLRGEDFTSHPEQMPSLWIINFFDWPLNRASAPKGYSGPVAEDFPECLEIVSRLVRPERLKKDEEVAKYPWWKYWRPRNELYLRVRAKSQVLFHSFTAKYVAFAFVPTNYVFAGPHNVFALDKYSDFAILQSSLHECWALKHCSTMETRIRYANRDLFDTFPFPENYEGLDEIGQEYYIHRKSLMQSSCKGLTDIYNQFHDPTDNTPGIAVLRKLHFRLNVAVAKVYGWQDLNMQLEFAQTVPGVRYCLGSQVRQEILDRLLTLNHMQFEIDSKDVVTAKRTSKRKVMRDDSDMLFHLGDNK